MKRYLTAFATALMLAAAAAHADEPKTDTDPNSPVMNHQALQQGIPQFDTDNALLMPSGYREWVFVGSALGLGYKETSDPKVGAFTHVYINPLGYRAYRDSGTFPVETVLMLEIVSRGEKTNPALSGHYSDKFVGLEAAVKTGDRFEDPWTYYSFDGKDRKLLPKAQHLTTKSCITCHKEHAETDHVFTQFYPVLRAVKPSE